jgi:hypothetical protein
LAFANRVIQLSRHLYESQPRDGFVEMARELRKRDLFGAAAELRAAHMLHLNGRQFRFVQPVGGQGENYDIAVEYEGTEIAVEVKSKSPDTSYTAKSLQNSLADARKQLPRDGPGVIVLEIPKTWADNPEFTREARHEIARSLQRGARVNAVVVLWDEWLPIIGDGYACTTRFTIMEHDHPRTQVSRLGVLLRGLTPDANSQAFVDNERVWGCFDTR